MTPPPFSSGDQVVAYFRDSGGDKQDLSVQQQEVVIAAFCQANDLQLIQTYRDIAQPGSSVVKRTAFLEMIEALSTNTSPARGVLVYKFSRIAREFDDSSFFKALLRRNGIEVYSLSENIPGGLDGRLFEAALDWMNARYLKDLSEDIRRSLGYNVTQHGAIGGVPPRGFVRGSGVQIGVRRDGSPHIVHRWVPDPDLAGEVLLAFQLRAAGKSYQAILRECPRLGYHSASSINHFFANAIYTGEMRYGGRVIQDYCAPIVPRDVWEQVQSVNSVKTKERVSNSMTHPRRLNSPHLLSGLIKCARCGAPMSGETITNKAKRWSRRYYVCSTYTRTHGQGCKALRIPAVELEKAVVDHVVNHFLELTQLQAIRDQAIQALPEELDRLKTGHDQAAGRAASVHRQIANVTDAVANIGHSAALLEKLRALESDLHSAEAAMRELDAEIQALTRKASDEDLEALISWLRPLLLDPAAPRDELRYQLTILIDHIDAERVENKIAGGVYFMMPAGVTVIERSHRSGPIYISKL